MLATMVDDPVSRLCLFQLGIVSGVSRRGGKKGIRAPCSWQCRYLAVSVAVKYTLSKQELISLRSFRCLINDPVITRGRVSAINLFPVDREKSRRFRVTSCYRRNTLREMPRR